MSREDINAVLKDVGLYDPNIANWISTSPDLRVSTDSEQPMFRLRGTGRDEAKKILEQVLNPEIKDEWPITERTRTRSKGSGDSISAEKAKGGSRKGRKGSTLPDSWAEKWNALNTGLDGHSIVEEASGLDKALFGLWAIRRASADAAMVAVSRLIKDKEIRPVGSDEVALTPVGQAKIINEIIPKWNPYK